MSAIKKKKPPVTPIIQEWEKQPEPAPDEITLEPKNALQRSKMADANAITAEWNAEEADPEEWERKKQEIRRRIKQGRQF